MALGILQYKIPRYSIYLQGTIMYRGLLWSPLSSGNWGNVPNCKGMLGFRAVGLKGLAF